MTVCPCVQASNADPEIQKALDQCARLENEVKSLRDENLRLKVCPILVSSEVISNKYLKEVPFKFRPYF